MTSADSGLKIFSYNVAWQCFINNTVVVDTPRLAECQLHCCHHSHHHRCRRCLRSEYASRVATRHHPARRLRRREDICDDAPTSDFANWMKVIYGRCSAASNQQNTISWSRCYNAWSTSHRLIIMHTPEFGKVRRFRAEHMTSPYSVGPTRAVGSQGGSHTRCTNLTRCHMEAALPLSTSPAPWMN